MTLKAHISYSKPLSDHTVDSEVDEEQARALTVACIALVSPDIIERETTNVERVIADGPAVPVTVLFGRQHATRSGPNYRRQWPAMHPTAVTVALCKNSIRVCRAATG